MNIETYVALFVVADGHNVHRSRNWLPSLLKRHNMLSSSAQGLHLITEGVQLVSERLHTLQQPLAVIQREFALAELRVHDLILPVTQKQIQ